MKLKYHISNRSEELQMTCYLSLVQTLKAEGTASLAAVYKKRASKLIYVYHFKNFRITV